MTDSNLPVIDFSGAIQQFGTAPDRALLTDCIAGRKQAWSTLHRLYYPVSLAFLRKLGVDANQIEDVCQEVFLQMHRYLPRFRGDADLTTWMYRICISEARRYRRRQKISRVITRLLGQEQPPEPSTQLDWNEASAPRRVQSALGELPARRRTILVLFDLEGLSGAQIAEIMGCSVASVWRELHYARQCFVQAFDRARPGGAP